MKPARRTPSYGSFVPRPLVFVAALACLSSCGRVGLRLLTWDDGGLAPDAAEPSGPLGDGAIAACREGALYTPDVSCGVGYCRTHNTASTCADGIETACMPAAPLAPVDTTCDGVDDDCDGQPDDDFPASSTRCGLGACARTGTERCLGGTIRDDCMPAAALVVSDLECNGIDDDCDGQTDEDFVTTPTQCGQGYCTSSGQRTCSAGTASDSCRSGAPRAPTDDAFTPGNGIDDDCDGQTDEDVAPCDTTPRTFEVGLHAVTVPGNCRMMTVRLWGGGGAAGGTIGGGRGGDGGPGGYSRVTYATQGTLVVSVGGGGASGCAGGGSSNGAAAYSGGVGSGGNGADGVASGGGAGARPPGGDAGGRGFFGGGGGGDGQVSGVGVAAQGAGGGAATALTVNGTLLSVAGGGGGGGGGLALHSLSSVASDGGPGGLGCGGNGGSTSAVAPGIGGGGGGGGVCMGASTQRGAGTTPYDAASIPTGRASGGTGNCAAGGNGYAIFEFSP